MRPGARTLPPTRDEVLGLLDYEPSTGLLRWKVTTSRTTRGTIAGALKAKGYIEVGIGKRVYMAHRLIWLIMKGEWPTCTVDHRNGRKADNRWRNLRLATASQQKMNVLAPSNSKTGVRGVSLCKQTGKWRVLMRVNGKLRTLGQFAQFKDAVAARRAAEREHFGEFAPELGVAA